MAKHGGKKAVLKNVAVALAVGAVAVGVTSYAAPKIPQLMQYPWLTPAVMIGAGLLLARRGRTASGIGLAGAGGALGFLLYGPRLMAATGTQPSANTPAQTAGTLYGPQSAFGGSAGAFRQLPQGYSDAGAMQRGDSGWMDRPAGTPPHGAGNLYGGNPMSAMGTPGDAGSLTATQASAGLHD